MFEIIIVIILFLCLKIFSSLFPSPLRGEGEQRKKKKEKETEVKGGVYNSENIVVDTLNLVHYTHDFKNKVRKDKYECIIKNTIISSAFDLKKIYTDKIMYVIKFTEDPSEQLLNDFQTISKAFRINIYTIVTNIKSKKDDEHVIKGRDDYLAIYLANKYNCKILSNDRYKDFKDMKKIPRFIAYSFIFYKDEKEILHIDPSKIELRKIHNLPFDRIWPS